MDDSTGWIGPEPAVTAASSPAELLAAARRPVTVRYRCPWGAQRDRHSLESRCTFELQVADVPAKGAEIARRLAVHLATHEHPSAPAGLDRLALHDRGGHWITRDGQILTLAEMSEEHLLACLRMLWRGRVRGYRLHCLSLAATIDADDSWPLQRVADDLVDAAGTAESAKVLSWVSSCASVTAMLAELTDRGIVPAASVTGRKAKLPVALADLAELVVAHRAAQSPPTPPPSPVRRRRARTATA